MGIDPVKSLSPKLNFNKFLKLSISLRIVPLMWAPEASNLSREKDEFPKDFGRIPFRGLGAMFKFVKCLEFVNEVMKLS